MELKEDKIREYCGVFAISCSDFSFSVAESIYQGLMAIQHRGQLFSGISTFCDGEIISYKNRGLVSKVLNPKRLKTISGNVGIGHVCYGSTNRIILKDAQPYHFKSKQIDFSLAMNGAITNYDELFLKLKKMGRTFTGKSDVELIVTLIEVFSKFSDDMVEALKMVAKALKGAYSIIILRNNGNIYAMKDQHGYKPLCYGKLKINNKKFHIISSESCAIDTLGGILKREIKPGEILTINPINDLKSYHPQVQKRQKFCQYEYIYFARPDSIINGISVAEVRYKLGRNLARNDIIRHDNTIVVPVPDSGRSAAMGYAWESKIPYAEGLMKNRYLWQLGSNVIEKLNPIKSVIKGKHIILIDDSILSGITMKKIISMLKREGGAKTVNVRISSPPILKNCELNSSLSNRDLLIAYQKKITFPENYVKEIKKYIGANTLKYQSIEGLIDAIGLDENKLCLACLKDETIKKREKKSQVIDLIV